MVFLGLTTTQRRLFPGRKLFSDMENLPEYHGQITHSEHIVTPLWRRQEHASQMTLEFYSHVTDCWQNVSHDFVVVPRPLVLRVALGRFLGGWVTGGVLGLGYMDYKVFLQLLSVDIVQFALAEIKKTLFTTKMKCSFETSVGQRKKKNSEFSSGFESMTSWIPVENLPSLITYHTLSSTCGKRKGC